VHVYVVPVYFQEASLLFLSERESESCCVRVVVFAPKRSSPTSRKYKKFPSKNVTSKSFFLLFSVLFVIIQFICSSESEQVEPARGESARALGGKNTAMERRITLDGTNTTGYERARRGEGGKGESERQRVRERERGAG